MIPIRLSLRNFMCYRDTPEVLDLTGVHLACLSGENGAGKSAILEAITWSLWGRARDRSLNDELIAKGATDMEVDYEFMLNGARYRVVRKRARKGNSGTTLLELQVCADEEADSWKILSGATINETQARINDLLKISYDTFINSAFIMQNRADEFTNQNPSERKKILANILGLEQYDVLEERAKEEAKERKTRLNELEFHIKQIDGELNRRPGYTSDLEAVEGQLIAAQESLVNARGELAALVAHRQQLEHNDERVQDLNSRLARREQSILSTKARILQYTARKQEIETLLAQREEIEQGYAALQAAQEEERHFNDSIALLRRLEGERATLEQQINGEMIRLDTEARQSDHKIGELKRNLAGRGVIEGQLSEVLERLRRLEQVQQQHEDARCNRENLDVKMRALTNEVQALEKEGKQLRQKLDLIMQAHAEGQGHANCPLCDTALSADALRRVQQSYNDEIRVKRQEYEQKRRELEDTNQEIVTATKLVDRLREQMKPVDLTRQREAELRHKLAMLDEDEHTLAKEESLLLQLRKRLSSGDYAQEMRAAREQVGTRIKSVNYDEAAHRAVTTRIAELAGADFNGRYHRLANAGKELASFLEIIEQGEADVEAMNAEQELEREEVELLRPQVAQLPGVKQLVDDKQSDVNRLADEARALAEQRGGLRNKLARCDELQEEKSRHMAEYNTANEEKTIYDDLSVAFGKKGIQAMIIENIIPEVEDEANALLSRMTDGRMSVEFATQRDAKTVKSVIETLDINISDEIGIRSYEMYSGGEAFRVNFAVRIALSKLLARRAGTQLQTLVIDEGFGSQDGQGREKLVAAIRSIQDDFEKILVITHIEELKDEFPVRINIVKTGIGSKIIRAEE